MSREADDEDHTTFLRMSLSEDSAQGPVLSRAAFQLHAFAMNNSVKDGTPGFISDDYLNAISAETSVTATELCMADLWERDEKRSGYVIHDPMVDEVVKMHERTERLKATCAATGGHETNEEFGSDVCCKCLSPLD